MLGLWVCGSSVSAGGFDAIEGVTSPTSPVSELLAQNRAPLVFESKTIQRSILEAESSISRLDTEINRLQETLGSLERKRKALDDYVCRHRGLMSPIRRFPSELMIIVFLFYIEGFCWNDAKRGEPWILGCVCSRWRQIAMMMPRLWCRPTFRLYKSPIASHVAEAKEWLARAGSYPLSVVLEGDCLFEHPVLDVLFS